MTDATEIADRYIAMWNETDAERRQAIIAGLWTEDGAYSDPKLEGTGHEGIGAMVGTVHAHYPGYRFARTGPVDMHHGRLRFDWTLAPADGPALVSGVDFAELSGERLKAVTGFFAPAAT
jgi:hypothetical protein